MKVIITGATGAAGLDILRAAISDTSITGITVFSRRDLPSTIPKTDKLTTIVDKSFPSSSAFYTTERLAQLKDHSACIWALGKTSMGMNEEDYTRLSRDWPVEALKALTDAGAKGEDGVFRFIYVSGMAATTDGTGAMWAQVKGKAETDLTSLAKNHTSSNPDHKVDVINIRPGYFFPSDPQDAQDIRPLWMRVADKVMRPLVSTFMKPYYIDARDLGTFAVGAAKGRVESGLHLNIDMRKLVEKWKVGAGK